MSELAAINVHRRVALCNGVRGLKYSSDQFIAALNVVALCNGVRGLKSDRRPHFAFLASRTL